MSHNKPFECYSCILQTQTYNWSFPWLRMTWRLMGPGHYQAQWWLQNLIQTCLFNVLALKIPHMFFTTYKMVDHVDINMIKTQIIYHMHLNWLECWFGIGLQKCVVSFVWCICELGSRSRSKRGLDFETIYFQSGEQITFLKCEL